MNDVTNKTSADNSSVSAKISKKIKKVQFQDLLNPNGHSTNGSKPARDHFATLRKAEQSSFSVLSQNSQDAQDNSITSTIESYSAATKPSVDHMRDTSDNDTPEVLDCRTAEKIKSELEQKMVVENGKLGALMGLKNKEEALCLTKTKDTFGAFDAVNKLHHIPKKDLTIILKPKRKLRSTENATFTDEKLGVITEYELKKKTKTKSGVRSARMDAVSSIADDEGNGDLDIYDNFDDKQPGLIDSDKDDDEFDSSLEDDNESIVDTEEDGEEEDLESEMILEENDNEFIKLNYCTLCNEEHLAENCPIRLSKTEIVDAITVDAWQELHSKENNGKSIKKEEEESEIEDYDEDDDDDDDNNAENKGDKFPSKLAAYAEMSIPDAFEIKQISEQKLSVFAKNDIQKYTRLGPLVGAEIAEVDIPDDCQMNFIYETYDGQKYTFISVENNKTANWLRFVRPAENRDARNVLLVSIDRKPYFVTSSNIDSGCELLYWSEDCNSAWGRKKIDKTSKSPRNYLQNSYILN